MIIVVMIPTTFPTAGRPANWLAGWQSVRRTFSPAHLPLAIDLTADYYYF